MSQEFNWNDVAYENAPFSQYSDFYSNQPRIYMFEGVTLIDLILLAATAVLTVFWLIYLFRSESGMTKALMTVTVTQILVNLLIRTFKVLVLILVQYPQFSWLFVASSVETTFHYTLYLQYTSSVLLYVFLREKDCRSVWALFYYLPSLSVSLLISTLNVNFNALLKSIPFYGYVVFYVAMAVSNFVILIAVCTSCTKFAREKLGIRCRLFFFVLIASPPTFFNTVITVMDLLFMVVGVTDQFPIPYIVMTTYRYKAFEVTPAFIMIAFFALLPDLRKWTARKTSTAEVTEIITEPPRAMSSSSKTISASHSVLAEQVPIPGQVQPQVSAPIPTYSTLNYNNVTGAGTSPYGALVVHIQPVQ
ncbi:unnamed protein product [Caenorhabditis sp. 36 PRJEB53466]|nr:unnamed protein product [Caenorhabditis sp. 36 PRJEB53466]